jgi:hypothetical protein
MSPLTAPTRQFNLQLIGEMESLSEPSIVIRRGSQVATLGRIWVLVMVSCWNRRAHLYYESWDGPVPIAMLIAQDIPRRPEIVGEYHLVEVE